MSDPELTLNLEQVDDVDTMLQYLLHDGREKEDFIDHMVDNEGLTEEQHELLLDQPDSKEASKLLDELTERRTTAHVWPAARRLEMTIRKFMTQS